MIDWLRAVHIACAGLSLAGFVLRGVWMLRAPHKLQRRAVKVLPHIIDTLLLASAIALAVSYRFSPFDHPWLMAKILALLVYIGLGTLALKRGKTRRIRLGAWLGAQLVFAYIVSVAISKDPAGYLIPLF